ncbi:MAG: hypothetical protein IJY64_03985 [Bacteroidaceae bacterium]|nr:hypothetical protein [Bacteroidaceae bacterium]
MENNTQMEPAAYGAQPLQAQTQNSSAAMQQAMPQNGVAEPAMPQSSAGEFQELNEVLQSLFGTGFSIENPESQRLLIKHLRDNREQNELLAEALGRDPRMAQMLADVVDGKRNAHSAMARYYGRKFMDFDEGSPEYEEILMADEERREEVIRLAQDRKEYEENLEASQPVIMDFCKQRGYDPSDFLEAVWERLVLPILSGTYTAEVCGALDNAINYEQDVEDAFAAGDIKGRNTNIQRMKENFGDGMPSGMTSVAPPVTNKPRRTNTLIDAALEA